jgi:hypothetical protein
MQLTGCCGCCARSLQTGRTDARTVAQPLAPRRKAKIRLFAETLPGLCRTKAILSVISTPKALGAGAVQSQTPVLGIIPSQRQILTTPAWIR